MKKISILVVIFILTSVGLLSGCTESDRIYYVKSDGMSHGKRQDGIIDKGDFLICKEISGKNEVITWAFGKTIDYKKYGDYGDVILYKNQSNEYIGHRAMCWVEYHDEYGTYSVEDYGMINVSNITIPELGLENYMPNNSGFITKADNRPACDQPYGVCSEPIKLEWIIGEVVKLIDMKRSIIPLQEFQSCS
jgi:signal peptidase I